MENKIYTFYLHPNIMGSVIIYFLILCGKSKPNKNKIFKFIIDSTLIMQNTNEPFRFASFFVPTGICRCSFFLGF